MKHFNRELTGIAVNMNWKAFNGYTLYMPFSDKVAKLIDMEGNAVHNWNLPGTPALRVELLPSGNLLYSGFKKNSPLADLEGAGGLLLEVDWDSKIVWKYEDPYLHHAFRRLPNGNTIIIKWVKVPKDIAKNVEGGLPGSERNGEMWADAVQEINPDGEIVWEWISYKQLDPKDDYICNLCPRNEWTQICGIDFLPDNENILLSMRKLHSVFLINKESKKTLWKWGRGELCHPSDTNFVENGNILIFDGGMHGEGIRYPFSRVLEVNPKTDEMEWEYRDENGGTVYFFNSFMGSCQRLLNGNTLICESESGRIFEITAGGEIVWEFVHPEIKFDSFYGNNNIIPGAYRYPPEYRGFPGQPKGVINIKRSFRGNSKSNIGKDKQKVHSRLERLGY